MISPGAYGGARGSARFQLPAGVKAVGGKEIKHQADSALFVLPVCGLHPCRGVCVQTLMSLLCSTGTLTPPTGSEV